MSQPVLPLVVFDGDDLGVYRDVESAENDLEPIDVTAGIYEGFDALGQPIRIEIEKKRTRISVAEGEPPNPSELEGRLRRFLEYYKEPDARNADCDLPCLIELAVRRAGPSPEPSSNTPGRQARLRMARILIRQALGLAGLVLIVVAPSISWGYWIGIGILSAYGLLLLPAIFRGRLNEERVSHVGFWLFLGLFAIAFLTRAGSIGLAPFSAMVMLRWEWTLLQIEETVGLST